MLIPQTVRIPKYDGCKYDVFKAPKALNLNQIRERIHYPPKAIEDSLIAGENKSLTTFDSEPVQCWVSVPFNFKLKKDRTENKSPVDLSRSSTETINSLYSPENHMLIYLLILLFAVYYITYYCLRRTFTVKRYNLMHNTVIHKIL